MREYFKQPVIAILIIISGFGIHLSKGSSAQAAAEIQPAASPVASSANDTFRADSLRRESVVLENTIAHLTTLDTDLLASIPSGGESKEVLALSARIDTIERTFPSLRADESALGLLSADLAKQRQAVATLMQLVGEQRAALGSVPLLTPTVGTLSSEFGERVHPITGIRQMHTGVDLAAPIGTAITAANAGTVLFAGVKSGYGNAVVIDHGHGYWTLYGHASKLLVKEGDRVEKGAEIALVGSTGISTGPHLHYEVIVDSTKINPLAFLQQPALALASRPTTTTGKSVSGQSVSGQSVSGQSAAGSSRGTGALAAALRRTRTTGNDAL